MELREVILKTAKATCSDAEDCAAIALGSKPCGGPWQYLTFSKSSTDVDRLRQLVAEYNQLEKELNLEQGRTSDCAVVIEPQVFCYEEKCQEIDAR